MPGLAPQLNLLIAGCHEHRGDRTAANRSASPRTRCRSEAPVGAGRVGQRSSELRPHRRCDQGVSDRRPVALRRPRRATRFDWVALVVGSSGRDFQRRVEKYRDFDRRAAKVEPAVDRADCLACRIERGAGRLRGGRHGASRGSQGETRRPPISGRRSPPCLSRGYGTLAAAEALSEGQNAAGESIEMRLARARLWADDIQPGRARRLAKLEELSPTIGDAERSRFLIGMAELYAGIRDAAGSMRTLTDLATRNTARSRFAKSALCAGARRRRRESPDAMARRDSPTRRDCGPLSRDTRCAARDSPSSERRSQAHWLARPCSRRDCRFARQH